MPSARAGSTWNRRMANANKPSGPRIRQQLTRALVLPLGLFSLLALVLALLAVHHAAQTLVKERGNTLAQSGAAAVAAELDNTWRLLEVVAGRPDAPQETFVELEDIFPPDALLAVLDENGTVLATSRQESELVGVELADQAAFQASQIERRIAFSGVQRDPLTGRGHPSPQPRRSCAAAALPEQWWLFCRWNRISGQPAWSRCGPTVAGKPTYWISKERSSITPTPACLAPNCRPTKKWPPCWRPGSPEACWRTPPGSPAGPWSLMRRCLTPAGGCCWKSPGAR